MPIFAQSVSALALLAGLQNQIGVISFDDFSGGFGNWGPGQPDADPADQPWTFQAAGGTASGSTGPGGGANPANGAVEFSNAYMFTEGSGTPLGTTYGLPSRVYDASLGLHTLIFYFHMRHGSVGGQNNGDLRVQGWNGSAWVDLGPAIPGSQQFSDLDAYVLSSSFSAFTSAGFSNSDFQFRILCTKTVDTANFDNAVDNITVLGPGGSVDPGSGGGGGSQNLFFNTGLRRLHYSPTGDAPLDGSNPDLPVFTNLQAAFDAVVAGDVLTLADDEVTGSFTINNANGTVQNPIWIVAENRGGLVISNYLQSVKAGTANWRDDGNGIYSIPGSRPYSCYHIPSGDFLPILRNVADINASSIPTNTGANNPSGSINKPQRGFTSPQATGGRISLKLRNGQNPNGQPIALTNGFSRTQLSVNNSENLIVDGIILEGGGDGASMDEDNNTNLTVRNFVFEGCQFGIRIQSDDTHLDYCEFFHQGTEAWQIELRALNGASTNAAFRYAKNYANAGTILGNGNFADALYEGGIDVSEFNTTNPRTGIILDGIYAHDCFDGCRSGRHLGPIIRNSVFEACLDDAIELERPNQVIPINDGFAAQVHDCLFKNCFSAWSVQGDFNAGNAHIYRNVVDIDNLAVVHPPFIVKTIFTPDEVDVNIYHNTIINRSGPGDGNEGFGGAHWVWFNFSSTTADRIRQFRNNIVIFPNDLDSPSSGAAEPANRNTNAVVSPSNNSAAAEILGSGGVYAGNNESDMGLNPDYTLSSGSPARGIGSALPGGLPDSRSGPNVNDDAGAFPFGEVPGPDWPRPARRDFLTTAPARWTFPGN